MALPLKQALVALQASIKEVLDARDKLDKSNIPDLLEFYRNIYECEDTLGELHKILKEVKDNFSKSVIPDTFESMGLDSIKSKGKTFFIGTRFNCSIPHDKREAGFPWLRENNLGALITDTVNARSLSSAIKELIETTGVEPPEDCITIHREKYTTMRKA